MTKQEAIGQLEVIGKFIGYDGNAVPVINMQKALKMSIKALEQQENMVHCKDCKWCVGWSKGLLCDVDKTTIVETFATNYCSWGESRGGE